MDTIYLGPVWIQFIWVHCGYDLSGSLVDTIYPVTSAAGGGTQAANCAAPEWTSPSSCLGHVNFGQLGGLQKSDSLDNQHVVTKFTCQVL